MVYRHTKTLILPLGSIALLVATTPAQASPSEAEELLVRAAAACDEADRVRCCALLEASLAAEDTARGRFGKAIECEIPAGRLRAARDALARGQALLSADAEDPLRVPLEDRLREVSAQIPRLRLALPSSGSIELDGAPIASGEVEVDPGRHRVTLVRGGELVKTLTFEITVGEIRHVSLEESNEGSPTTTAGLNPWFIAGVSAGAVGLGGLVAVIVTGVDYIEALDMYNTARACEGPCPASLGDLKAEVDDLVAPNAAAWAVFGISLVSSIVFVSVGIASSNDDTPAATVRLLVNPAEAGGRVVVEF